MKNKKISIRLFVMMLTLIVGFSAMLLVANSLLLKPLYYASVKRGMSDTLDTLMTIDYTQDEDDWLDDIRSVNTLNAGVVVEVDGVIIYSSSNDIGIVGGFDKDFRDMVPPTESDGQSIDDNLEKDKKFNDRRDPFYLDMPVEDWEYLDESTKFGIMDEPSHDNKVFIMEECVNESIVIHVVQNVEPVLESVQQANQLLLVVTALFLIVAVLAAFRLAKAFTKPIRQMQNYVGELSALNFESTCDVNTGDELQSLNEDITFLSNTLENTLDELKQKNKMLEREVVAQRKFISNASHELRTPLALIKGYADEIAGGFVSDRDQEHIYIGYIAQESTKMKRLLNEILELSRLESGRMTFEAMTFDVKDAIEQFLDKYAGFVEEHQLAIEVVADEGDGQYDLMRFEQVLANFLSNAAKYGDDEHKIIIRSELFDEYYRVSVFNTGSPIPEDVMAFIWDGFYKADESRSQNEGSYGLGLSIVKAIQNVAGRAYGVENTPDGVRFWFDIKK